MRVWIPKGPFNIYEMCEQGEGGKERLMKLRRGGGGTLITVGSKWGVISKKKSGNGGKAFNKRIV